MTAQTVVQEILDYVGGERRAGWYAGIASDPRARLFEGHGVNERAGAWIFRNAGSESTARAAEAELHNLGFDGAGGGGDSTTTAVYAYRKAVGTSP